MKKINLRLFVIFFALFIICGTIFLILLLKNNLNNKNYVETVSTVEKIEEDTNNNKHVYVRYEIYNMSYLTELNNYDEPITIGNTITILVNPAKPKEIIIPTINTSNIVFIVIMSISYSLAFISFILLIIKINIIRFELREKYN